MRSAVIVAVCFLVACDVQTARVASTETQYPKSAAADSLIDAANALYDDSEYDSAAVLLRAARAIAVTDGDSLKVAQADTKLGLAQFHLGDYAAARKTGEAALAMKLRLGMKQELFKSYNALGLLAYTSGRYADASQLFRNAKAAADSLNDSLSAAKAVGNLGLVHSDVGQFEDARREYELMYRLALAQHDTTPMANALANTGMLLIRAGDAQSALSYLERARPFYVASDDAQGQEMVLGQLGSAYFDLGELQKAIAYVDSALAVARKYAMKREETEDLEIFAELFGSAGDHATALKNLNRAAFLAKSIGLEAREGDILRAQAREFAALLQIDKALEYATKAADAHKRVRAPLNELEDRLIVAEIAQRMGKGDLAKRELQSAAALSRSLRLPLTEEQIALGTARVADIRRDPAAVLGALPAGMTFPHLGSGAAGEADALRARAFARLRQWPEAARAGQNAIASLDRVRGTLGEGALRSAFTNDNAEVYADLIVALLQLGRTEDAFEVADAARGKALLEHLNAVKSGARATSSELSRADELLRRIDYLTNRLRLADTVPTPERSLAVRNDLQDLSDKLADAREEYESRMNAVARTDPRGASLLGASSASLTEIRKALRPDEMIVEYFAGARTLFVFAASRDTVIARTRAVQLDDLANRVRFASSFAATSKSRADGISARRALYDILIGPIDSIPASRRAARLIIVPHSALAYLPFAALVSPSGKNLIETRSLLMLQSASALPYLRRAARSSAAITSIFAPFPQELSGTLEEARLVKREVPKPRVFIGAVGTERELRSALEKGGTIHIASHGLLNQSNPMFSHVELARTGAGQPSDDGRLDVHELLRMNVKSDLVFLSGCETGAGASWSTSFRRNQDYATLSQALLYAGAQNVVATLWRIDDAGASVFASRFYRALKNGDVVDALASAQRETLRDARYAAPKYWAGYTVSGAAVPKAVSQNQAWVTVQ